MVIRAAKNNTLNTLTVPKNNTITQGFQTILMQTSEHEL